MNLSDGQTHDLELYFLDWDNQGRTEQVQISSAATGTVLSTRSIASFGSGVYLDYAVSGNIVITITTTSSHNAVLSGLFLDPPAATATFVKQDATTSGNWVGTYGSQGDDIQGYTASLPAYATVAFSASATPYTWSSSTTDTRGRRRPASPPQRPRVAASWFSKSSFNVNVNLSDGQTHDLELYFLDWDNQGRTEQVQISGAATGTVLSTRSIASFGSGVYLDYAVSGNIVITITTTSSHNAVLSGCSSTRRPTTWTCSAARARARRMASPRPRRVRRMCQR